MEVAVVAKLKNWPLLKFRRERNLTQAQAAKLCGLPSQAIWSHAECLDFKGVGLERMQAIANIIDCDLDDIYPQELRHRSLRVERIAMRDVPPEKLIEADPPESQIELMDSVKGALLMLTARERKIIKLRYGIGDDQSRSLGEIGKACNVTRERVRQVLLKAEKKLRNRAGRRLEQFV